MNLLVVVLNYRTPDLTIQCLASLEGERETVPGLHVAVVDNDSGDGSADTIGAAITARGWEAWTTLVRAERNGGFAYGNNRGLEAGFASVHPRYVLLLNSDTIVQRGAIAKSIAALEQHPKVGVLSCRLANADGSFQNVCRKFPSPLRLLVAQTGLPWRWPRLFGWADCEDLGWDRDRSARDVDWVGGAFMLMPAAVVERLGGLDEGFFFYGEDIEFCYRVRRAGWRVRYDPVATVTHLGGASSDPTRLPAESRSVHRWRARYLVQRRCYGAWAAALARMSDLFGARVRLAIMRWRGTAGSKRSEEMRSVVEMLTRQLPAREPVPPMACALRLGSRPTHGVGVPS